MDTQKVSSPPNLECWPLMLSTTSSSRAASKSHAREASWYRRAGQGHPSELSCAELAGPEQPPAFRCSAHDMAAVGRSLSRPVHACRGLRTAT